MIFFNKTMSEDILNKIIEKETSEICTRQKIFNCQEKTLLLYIQKLTNSIQKIDHIDNSIKFFETLSKLKESLDKMHHLNSLFKQNLDMLKSLSYSDIFLEQKIYEYNNSINALQNDLDSYTVELEEFFQTVLKHIDFVFSTAVMSNSEKTSDSQLVIQSEENGDVQTTTPLEENIDPETIVQPEEGSKSETIVQPEEDSKSEIIVQPEEDSKSETETPSIIESQDDLTDNNCLLISEKQNKVFLPYRIKQLEQQLANSPNNYSDIHELIEKEYILPLNRFKNPILARFKEAYILMKNKEHSTVIDAFDLALELSLNSNLNPAVIAACSNLNELDIYLDCLHEHELEKFNIFEIIYEVNPTVK